MERKTKIEILDETAAAYTLETRSLKDGGGGCLYVNSKGLNCAFSRCCTEEGKKELHNIEEPHEGTATSIKYLCKCKEVSPDHFLREEYHGHDVMFWSEVQNLHDDSHNWDANGLSKGGREVLADLKSKYQ